MTITQSWYIERRVVSATLSDKLTNDDIQAASQQGLTFVQEGDGPLVHFICDVSNLDEFPLRLPELYQSTEAILRDNQKLGWVVTYGNMDTFLSYLSHTLLQMFRVRFRMFDTEEAARAFLNRVDSTLPDLPPIRDYPEAI